MFREMPAVLATGFMVGLIEWACIELLRPHLDWPAEQSLGTHVNFSHIAATPPGLTVAVDVKLDSIEGRKLVFTAVAHDGIEPVSEGTHERVIIDVQRFRTKLTATLSPHKACVGRNKRSALRRMRTEGSRIGRSRRTTPMD